MSQKLQFYWILQGVLCNRNNAYSLIADKCVATPNNANTRSDTISQLLVFL